VAIAPFWRLGGREGDHDLSAQGNLGMESRARKQNFSLAEPLRHRNGTVQRFRKPPISPVDFFLDLGAETASLRVAHLNARTLP
jgi:hypothetical protein